jgi:uncharacterized protein YfaS (alpha-2-macroglobulin family)
MKSLLLFLTLALPLLGATRLSISTTTITPESKIELVFDHPLVAPDQIGKPLENTLLKITPAWKTKLTWRSQNIATLLPQEAPQIGTSYQFSLPKALTSTDGTAIPAEKFKPLASEPFTISRTQRIGSTRTGGILLLFNDTVNPTTAASFFQFISPETKDQASQIIASRTRQATWGDLSSRYYYQNSWQDRFAKKNLRYAKPTPPDSQIIPHALVVEPVTPLPIGEKWSLRRLADLPSATVKATIKGINHYPIGNVVPFIATSIYAATTPDQPRTIRISLNQSLPLDLQPADFLKHLKFATEIKDLKATFDNRRQNITLHGGFGTNDTHQLTLANSLHSADGLPLKSSLTKDLTFSRLSPNILLPSFDESQLARGSRTYQIQSINNQSLRLRIKRLTPKDQIRASLGYRHYTGNGPNSERIKNRIALPFELITGKVVCDEEIILNAPLDTTHTHTLNWDQYLPKNQIGGAFFISVTGTKATHPDLKNKKEKLVQSLVQLTDLGLAWKLTDDSAFLYAYSCHTGKALPNVQFSLFGEDATPLEKATTDADGIATLPRTKTHRLLRAQLAGDTLILPFDDSLPTVSMWRFPVTYEWGKAPADRRLVGMFTDRSLYRPGETIHLKGHVRHLKKDDLHLPTSINPKLTITDPMHRVIHEKDLTLSTTGSFDISYQLPTQKVGNYYLALEWPAEVEAAEKIKDHWEKRAAKESATFSIRIAVQEFKRNTFELKSTLTDKLAYNINAKYFQGTPVAKGKVSWNFSSDPTGFYPPNHRDFLFGDHRGYDSDYWNHYFGYNDNNGSTDRDGSHSENGKTELSDSGELAMNFQLPELKVPAPRRTSVRSEVMDANSQTLSSSATTTIHSSDFYLGLLRQDRITRVGNEIPFKVVAVNQKGKLHTAPVIATLTVEREVNTQTKSKAPNGRIVIKNEASLVPVSTRQITLPDGRLDLPFTPTESGKHFFTLTTKDASDRPVKTIVTRQVYGSDEYPWAYENGMRIKLVPQKKRYLPGDTARILVLSPIEGEALITVEHQKVTRQFRTQLTLDNPVIEIPLTEADAPNAFISVLVIKGAADSKRKNPEPQLRLGYCELTVDPAASRLQVDLATTKSETRPGEMITVSGTVLDHKSQPVSAAEVTFYAVDEGTLAVIGYDNPNPLALFHQPRALRIKNGTSLDNFIPESLNDRQFGNKGFIIGGGGMGSLSAHETLKPRNDFNPTATWMPSLLSGKDGTFTAKFKAPDTLTRYRLIAVAHHGTSRFGTGLGQAIVNKPVMLEPSPPAFAHEGDSIKVKALLQNTTAMEGTWKVSLKLDSTTTSADKILTSEVSLKANGQSTVEFDVTFANTGTAKWTWSTELVSLSEILLIPKNVDQQDPASAKPRTLQSSAEEIPIFDPKRFSDSVESTFEVRYPMPLLREVQFATFNDPTKQHNLLDGFSQNLLQGRGHLEVEFARSRLLEAAGAIDYLLRYPYGCAEQTTSSTIPWIAAKNLRHLAPGFQKKSVAQIDNAIQAGADRLLGMQTSDGGIAYWSGGRTSSAWATSYAALGLVMCQEAGANVPQSSLDQLAKFLSTSLRGISGIKTDSHAENYARTLYVLARLGKPEHAYQAKLYEKYSREGLPRSARAFLSLAFHASKRPIWGEILQTKVKSDPATGYWMPSQNSDAFELLAWSTVQPDSPQCEAALTKLLAKRSPRGHWNTTWANAWSLLAMANYAKTHETSHEDIHLVIQTSDGPQNVTLPKDKPSHTITLPLEGGFKLLATSDARTYVHTTLAAKPKIAPVQPVSKNGLSITRQYERVTSDGKSEPLTNPKVGDLVKITLTLAIPDRTLSYLAIDDPLPSSFAAINTDFESQAGRIKDSNNWKVSHQEIRLDRALFFIDHPRPSQNQTITYHARITHPGQIFAPSTKAEEMYNPTSFALSATKNLTIQ